MTKKKDEMSQPRGVSLKVSEWREVESIADKLNVKPGNVAQYAIRYFLKQYKAGEIKPVTKTTKELPEL